MRLCRLKESLTASVVVLVCCAGSSQSQGVFGQAEGKRETLQYVVYLSRHGVRSPTKEAAEYNPYSAAPWPQWNVPPGYLTPHGFILMKLFGKYDRAELAAKGLLLAEGCADAAHVTILADSDQRTRETGKAIAEGMFPGCNVEVHALPEGTNDPLFHAHRAGPGNAESGLALAAIAGRIGGDPNNLTESYRTELSALDHILAGCGKASTAGNKRISLFDIQLSLGAGKGEHSFQLRGPLSTASTLSENLLLEYAEGFTGTKLGWGCLDENALREVMDLHTAAADFEQRTPVIASESASNMLDHFTKSLEQSAAGKSIEGALGRPGDRVLFLSGHDTNIATVAGSLGLDWIIDGRRDDTPPGGTLVFELWRADPGGDYRVRVFYMAQTLNQMRTEQALSLEQPPLKTQLFVPRCSESDMSCSLAAFVSAVKEAINPAFVSAMSN